MVNMDAGGKTPSSPTPRPRSAQYSEVLNKLSHYAWPIGLVTFATYVVLMVVFWCTVQDAPYTPPAQIHRISSWCFFIVAMSNFRTVAVRSKDSGRVGQNSSMYCVIGINLVALTSHTAMSLDLMPVGRSIWGRPVFTAQMAEWLSVLPLLMILMHSLHDSEYLSPPRARSMRGVWTWLANEESAEMWRSVSCLTLSTYLGVLVTVHNVGKPVTCVGLLLSSVLFLRIFRTRSLLVDRLATLRERQQAALLANLRMQRRKEKRRSKKNVSDDEDSCSSEEEAALADDVVLAELIERNADGCRLCTYCAWAWTTLAFVYFLAAFNLITVEHEMYFNVMFDVGSKALYSSAVGDIHFKFLSPERLATLLLKLEDTISANRSIFLRYVMNEVNVPLGLVKDGVDTILLKEGKRKQKIRAPPSANALCTEVAQQEDSGSSSEEESSEEEETNKVLRSVRTAIMALTTALDDTLHLASTEDLGFLLDIGPMDIVSTLQGAFQMFEAPAALSGIRLTVSVAPDVPAVVLGDARRLALVVTKFTADALKFTEAAVKKNQQQQPREPRVGFRMLLVAERRRLRSYPPMRHRRNSPPIKQQSAGVLESSVAAPLVVRVRVEIFSDEGAVPEMEISLVDPESPTEEKDCCLGTMGLGLTIAKNLVELHGGFVGFKSKKPGDSTLFFVVPLEVADASSLLPLNRLARERTQGFAVAKASTIDDEEEEASQPLPQLDKEDEEEELATTTMAPCDEKQEGLLLDDENGLSKGASCKSDDISKPLDPSSSGSSGSSTSGSSSASSSRDSSSSSCKRADDVKEQQMSPKSRRRSLTEDRAEKKMILSPPSPTRRIIRKNSSQNTSPLTKPGVSVTAVVRRALVVDDVAINRKLLARALTNMGFSCSVAEDGKLAVEALQKEARDHYCLVCMDYVMPVMNGLDATKIIRAEGYRGLLLACTGNAHEEDIADFHKAGADDVLVKPISLPKMKELTAHLIAGAET